MAITDMASLQSAVAAALKGANLPADVTGAFALVATPAGVKGVLSAKIGGRWTLDTFVSVDTKAHIEGGVQIKTFW